MSDEHLMPTAAAIRKRAEERFREDVARVPFEDLETICDALDSPEQVRALPDRLLGIVVASAALALGNACYERLEARERN